MYGLIGKIIAVDGRRDELATILHEGSRAMAGCLSYVVALDAAEANALWVGDMPTGYWEWFRKDGTIMRSGQVRDGIQVGKWTTYDKNGVVYKVTDMKEGKKGAKKTIVEWD